MQFFKKVPGLRKIKNFFALRKFKNRFNRSFKDLQSSLSTETTADDRFRLSEMRDALVEIKKADPEGYGTLDLEKKYSRAVQMVEKSHLRAGERDKKYWKELKDKKIYDLKRYL
ncbi:MAG: hypothetical protein JW727_01810 [Candidatus Aenigmarchaeota archaeon]|nr:hypothetical protein [Candidatus Aenigmarchaeota archaeon]